tara:strand:- start:741 stop:1193 length:453 start_codon:yes stop_codon:yes gene_type:complete
MSDLKLRYKQQEKLEDKITRLKKQLNAARDAKVSCREDIKNLEAEQAKIAEAEQKREANRERYQIRKICKKYDVSYEDDHTYDYENNVPVRYSKWWVGQPTWLEGDDPLEDGHFAHRLDEVLWLVEFYAKHHPDHPDYAKREYLDGSPHC